MSNAVDILLVGGPRNGTMYCVARNRIPETIEPWPGEMAYTVIRWTNMLAQSYHIAIYDENVTSGEIEATIEAKNFQPAWDLNR